MTSASTDLVRVTDSSGVRVITWNRPNRLNAMSIELWDATRDAIRSARLAHVRAIVCTGTGRAFTAGQDLNEMTDPRHADPNRGFRGMVDALQNNPVPLLAAVNGLAVGIGTTFLPWCDIAIAAESARFRVPFVSLGVTTEAGSSASLPELMGPQAAAAFVLAGEWLSASDAATCGLVWKVVPDDELMPTTIALAERIAEGGPDSLFTTRRLMTEARVTRMAAAVERENAEFARLAGGPENLAAIEKFLRGDEAPASPPSPAPTPAAEPVPSGEPSSRKLFGESGPSVPTRERVRAGGAPRITVPRSIARVLDAPLQKGADREALVTRSARLSYAELDSAANRAAHALRGLGIRQGSRVAASLPNDIDVVVAFHGAMRIGAVWVGINRALAAPEKQYLLDDSGAVLLLCDDEVPGLGARVLDLAGWRLAVEAADATPVDVDIDPHAAAGIAYTSGTTGHPKGATHSQHNLLVPGAVLVETRGYDSLLRKGDCFPFTVLNMAVLTTLLVSQCGGCSVVMDRVDAEGIAEWIRTEHVTTWNGAPAMLHSLAASDVVESDDLHSLDEVWTGGGDCPEAIRDAFEAKFGKTVLATYGLSEAPTVVTIDPRGGPHVTGSSGRPLPHLSVRIAGSDDETLPYGETGEVCVGPADDLYTPMLGYWERPEATDEALAGGDLHTGDLGFFDPDGNLHIRDRKTLVIIRGGTNVYPAEVERVLYELPEVASAAVVGVPDERLGERVVAVIEPVAGAEIDDAALRAHCELNLAPYKIPERFIRVDALPRNAMGKIIRAELADLV